VDHDYLRYYDSTGAFDFRGFHGTYEITVSVPGKEPFVKTIELTKGNGTAVYTLLWTELMPEMFCMGI